MLGAQVGLGAVPGALRSMRTRKSGKLTLKPWKLGCVSASTYAKLRAGSIVTEFGSPRIPSWVDVPLTSPFGRIVAGLIAEGQSEPAIRQEFFDRWVSPRRTATIADLERAKNAGELRSETEPEVLNDAIFGAIYYRLLLRSGPLTKRFGEELVEQVIRGHRSGKNRS